MAIFKITVRHAFTLNVPSVLNLPSAQTAETSLVALYGIIDGAGTNSNTSSDTLIVDCATPSTPLASVYKTSTGIETVACTLAQLGLSASLSIFIAVIFPVELSDLALIKVKGYVGFAGTASVKVKV